MERRVAQLAVVLVSVRFRCMNSGLACHRSFCLVVLLNGAWGWLPTPTVLKANLCASASAFSKPAKFTKPCFGCPPPPLVTDHTLGHGGPAGTRPFTPGHPGPAIDVFGGRRPLRCYAGDGHRLPRAGAVPAAAVVRRGAVRGGGGGPRPLRCFPTTGPGGGVLVDWWSLWVGGATKHSGLRRPCCLVWATPRRRRIFIVVRLLFYYLAPRVGGDCGWLSKKGLNGVLKVEQRSGVDAGVLCNLFSGCHANLHSMREG